MQRRPIDTVMAQWGAVRPDVDAAPMAIWGRIARLHQAQAAASEASYAELGITNGDFAVLAALRRNEPKTLSAGDLIGELMISSGGVTQRVDRLADRGLVDRRSHPDDRRRIVITLTTSGRGCIDTALSQRLAAEEALLHDLSPRQRADLARLLSKLGRD
ncbi:MAG: pecS [Pseudonocardiales bacterium]|nr:pecS [Pseudonocardiales bacterium]